MYGLWMLHLSGDILARANVSNPVKQGDLLEAIMGYCQLCLEGYHSPVLRLAPRVAHQVWTYIESGLAQYQAWANADPEWQLRFGPSDPAARLSQRTHIHHLEAQVSRLPALASE